MIPILLFLSVFRQNFAEVVKIDQGLLNGTVLLSRDGTPYQAFYAIPFTKPPVGNLRFKPPTEAPSWAGVRQSQTKGPNCIQSGYGSRRGMAGTEDCLYLSVFTRELQPKKLVPVMVYIHGGAFCAGSGDQSDFHPLMDKPIVVVSINYRVGIFGFFSSNDEIIPGNFGLKDQSAALRWVQKNIKHFGGDPQSVTIFGQSAGSVSVHLHLISPLSKGLFHRAIMESGSGRSLWGYYNKYHSRKAYEDTMKRTNCTTTSSLKSLECLQTLPALNLWQIEQDIKTEENLMLKYRPVIENDNQTEAFLTGDPHVVSYQDPSIPIIMGFNSAEGIMDTVPILRLSKNMTVLDEKLEKIIPQRLHYYYTTNHQKQLAITKMIKKFYFTDGVLTKGQEQKLCDIMSDYIFIMPIIDAVISYPGPKYTYMYDYRNAVSFGSMMFNISLKDLGLQGASHTDELLDLLYFSTLSPKLSKADLELSKIWVTYWTNFAYSGDPNKHENVSERWQPAIADPLQYLYVNNTVLTMKTGPLTERHKNWLKCPLSHQYGKRMS